MGKVLEFRKNKRYKSKEGIFIVLRPQAPPTKLGNLVDISLGGLAFQYYQPDNRSYSDIEELDIYISGDGCYLDNIPINIITEITKPDEGGAYPVLIKRYGVKFGNLTADMRNRLAYFIKQYTEGEVEDI